MENEKGFLRYIENSLRSDTLPNLQKFHLWQDLSSLVAAEEEAARTLAVQSSLLRRLKCFLKTELTYYACRRRVKEKTKGIYPAHYSCLKCGIGIDFSTILKYLNQKWRFWPGQKPKRSPRDPETRLLVKQVHRRLVRCRNTYFLICLISFILLIIYSLLANLPLEISLPAGYVILFGYAICFALILYYFAVYIFLAARMIGYTLRPPQTYKRNRPADQ